MYVRKFLINRPTPGCYKNWSKCYVLTILWVNLFRLDVLESRERLCLLDSDLG